MFEKRGRDLLGKREEKEKEQKGGRIHSSRKKIMIFRKRDHL